MDNTNNASIEFDISRDDYVRMQELFVWHIPVMRYTLVAVVVTTVIVAIVLVPATLRVSVVVSSVALLIAMIVTWQSIRFILRRIPSDGGGFLGHHTIQLLPEGIRETTAVNDGFHSWSSVTDVIETHSYVLLVIGRAMVHCIPVRSFPTHESAREFADAARRYRAASEAPSRTPPNSR